MARLVMQWPRRVDCAVVLGQNGAMFAAISKDLASVSADSQEVALRSNPDVSELAFAVHSLTRCVERLLGQVITLKFEVESLRLVESESAQVQGQVAALGIVPPPDPQALLELYG